ncbi:anthranilate phosphoribosyltransferase [Reinekea marinisedimentorum]|uniref:Anthranilate phosphoribosyltransferase n=1 Tax=Reinekea marinisedimentorum TaxID=230495 RepID=A0A4R3HTC5_9GAMM|nr:anthranilate phosphoribosyltransferase [Reinekea marinisedimentorum]TCS36456.1 anthranilate phosphoribosyltransferase [Reinekea marinisedimentorum]
MDIKQALARLAGHGHLNQQEMQQVMRQIMLGDAADSQIGAFLMGLRMKGETVDEIVGAASVMRELSTKVTIQADHLVDTCGTGGSGQKLFNVSTASAFVVAAAGAHVAKHGNRGVSSGFGSADLLEAAGVNLDILPDAIARAIETVGVGFMFAQKHHSAMRHAIGPRKEMGIRTIFNMLGPLTNPAGVTNQVIGVFSAELCEPLANALKELGSQHVLVVHSDDGLDEFSIAAPTQVAELKDGEIKTYKVEPEDFGLATQSLAGLNARDAVSSLALIKAVFSGESTEETARAADLIALNAGAAIYASGVAGSFAAGVAMAEDAISTGLAAEKLKEFAQFTQSVG